MSRSARGVFLDRDGVLNELVYNPLTMAYESPHHPEDLKLSPDIINPLRKLRERGFMLFIVSNQPSYAKSKTTLSSIKQIAQDFQSELEDKGITFDGAFYCYHHPDGDVPGYSLRCECRKPNPFFLIKAQNEFDLDLTESWMIGDRDSDIECGRLAGCKTILIKNPHSTVHQGKVSPDYVADNLQEAVYYRILGERSET